MIKYVQELIPAVLDILLCMMYFNILFGSKKKSILTFVWVLSYILMEIPIVINSMIYREMPDSDTYVIFFTLISLFTLALISFEYTSTIRHKVFAVLSFQVIAGVAESISNLLQSDRSLGNISVYGVYIFSKLIMCLFIFFVALIYKGKSKEITIKYSLQLLYIPAINLIILFFIWKKEFVIDNDHNNLVRLFISFSIILVCILNYLLLNIQLQNALLKLNQKTLEEQTVLQKLQYEQTISSYRELRSIVHDEKKHMLYLRECVSAGEYEKLNSYINDNISELEHARFHVNTGNLAIDAMLGSTIKRAKNLNCEINTNIQIDPQLINLSDHDLCVIIGNMSDNALRAVSQINREQKTFFNIELFMTHTQFVIHMINSTITGNILKNSNIETNVTDVSDEHGYGLVNIKNTIAPYNGIMRFRQEDDRFDASVIIPLLQSKEV